MKPAVIAHASQAVRVVAKSAGLAKFVNENDARTCTTACACNMCMHMHMHVHVHTHVHAYVNHDATTERNVSLKSSGHTAAFDPPQAMLLYDGWSSNSALLHRQPLA